MVMRSVEGGGYVVPCNIALYLFLMHLTGVVSYKAYDIYLSKIERARDVKTCFLANLWDICL